MKKTIIAFCTVVLIGLGVYVFLPFETRFFLKRSTVSTMEKLPFYINRSGWGFSVEGRIQDQRSYSFDQNDGDTLKHIIFFIDDEGDPTSLFQYKKRFPSGDGVGELLLSDSDTIYQFYETNGVKEFRIGGYFYKFSTIELESAERDFYFLYQDSLNKVRGNNLPKLPLLTENERLKFDAIFK